MSLHDRVTLTEVGRRWRPAKYIPPTAKMMFTVIVEGPDEPWKVQGDIESAVNKVKGLKVTEIHYERD
jgi:hypothetical protein